MNYLRFDSYQYTYVLYRYYSQALSVCLSVCPSVYVSPCKHIARSNLSFSNFVACLPAGLPACLPACLPAWLHLTLGGGDCGGLAGWQAGWQAGWLLLVGLSRQLCQFSSLKGHPHASIMYQVSGQNSLPYEVNIMRGCVSFQIKVQILAFYTDVCTGHKPATLEDLEAIT